MPYTNIREEELKNKVAQDYFADFDSTQIIGNVDFCVSSRNSTPPLRGTPQEGNFTRSLLWAEAKAGKSNIYTSFVQLILTIGKARTFDKVLPPAFLGAFDAFQIAFIPYNEIQEIFYQNDFNWNVTPSNYETKEFKQIYEMVEKGLSQNSITSKIPLLRGGKFVEFDGVDSWKQKSLFPFWNLPKNKDLEPNAKKLKKIGVLSEVLFWQAFKNKKLLGWDIDRQVIIGNYIVDFFIPEIGLVIEIDGESHDFKGEHDVERENYLQSLGLEIIHYTDIEIKKSMDFVSGGFQMAIKKRVDGLKKSTPSGLQPATTQEGNLGGATKSTPPSSDSDPLNSNSEKKSTPPTIVGTPQEGNLTHIPLHNALIFAYETDEKELREFIKTNFVVGKSETSKIQIDKNNFIIIYNKWLAAVKPSIIINWESAKKAGIIDGDFYLADLLSSENQTLKEKLYILLKGNYYEVDRKLDEMGFFSSKQANFSDNQKAHNQFWNRYQRPPREEYWDYIVERRDLLVPQDVRERKGSFFTPQIWVEKSQEYLTDSLGENWQDEYYIWDCASGTGNLLTGLTNKYNIYASTLDTQDVDVMKERIETMNQNSISGHGANLLPNHVFQFDFLNDSFNDPKVPESLRKILKDPEKRKKLVIYINPPYAEATSYWEKEKSGVAIENKMNEKYKSKIGKASNELFALFMARIYGEIENAHLALFSTMKYAQSSNFVKFRGYFLAEFKKGFVVPADTFDNVKGKFPIGFLIWDTGKKEKITDFEVDIFDRKSEFLGKKSFYGELGESINKWIKSFEDKNEEIGLIVGCAPDFQTQNQLAILSKQQARYCLSITKKNLIPFSIYFTVRHCIKATWLNDRDQFLFPNDGWKTDTEFQNDCLAFSLFHGQNRISSKLGVNHWIPFTENDVNAPERFESRFMTEFISGKLRETPKIRDFDPLKGVTASGDFAPSKGLSATQTGVFENEVFHKFTDIGFVFPVNKDLNDRAKEMAKNMTKAEQLIWFNILASKKTGYKWVKQRVIDNYIVDFCCQELGLIIEIDGNTHTERQEYDKVRTDLLNHFGLQVIRYTNDQVYNNLESVSTDLRIKIAQRLVEINNAQSILIERQVDVSDDDLFGCANQEDFVPSQTLEFSPEAKAVFEAGRELWRYYHKEPNCNVNASLYDIKAHFQGQNELGRMNNKSTDEKYNLLIDNLRNSLDILSLKIQPKVYEFGFLK